MQHVGGHYNTGNTTAFHSMHFTPAADSTTTNVSGGPTTTSVLRSWRKKDASEKQPSTTSSSAEPPSGNVSENQGPVARVAPHNHYPKPSPADLYRYPQQHGEYGVQNVSQLPAPVKYSEIIEPMQSIEQIPPILQKPKEKTYLEMCNIQQNHMKPPYQDYQNYKQHYDGLKNYNHMSTYKQQYHPYLQKESQMPGYVQKEANIPPQYLHNYKMSPSNYPRNYPREGNEFLANLNKIAPDMAQDIINDPHLRDPHLREPQFPMYPPPPSIDQNRLYQQQQQQQQHQRMYQRTSPIQHGVQNYGQRSMPQNYNQYQMNQQRLPPSDHYRMYSTHQRYGQVEPQMPTNISPRQYHENMMGFPPRISPNYPSCGQLEYAQHYQHRQVPMRQEFLPIPNKPYIETHPEIPEIVPDESVTNQSKKTLKAFLENWREEFTEDVESTEAIATDKIQLVKSAVPNKENTLYVLDAMEIPQENIPQYLHLQPIDKLPPNIRAFTYNAEENVRQNAIVISTNVKGDEINKNDVTKDSGNTYQLFQNKSDGSTDSLVYQANVLNHYKHEDMSSHEDRPACKLLQSMVKARNANANGRPLEKLDRSAPDKDKILRNCFQEPLKDVCRSLPQLINEETVESNKNNEEHLENEYSKIVDSILEENTKNVMPTVLSAGDISGKLEKKEQVLKKEKNLTTIASDIDENSSINFTQNIMKSIDVVERKSVIAENTLPHILIENQPKNAELQNSYLFSIAEEHMANSTTTDVSNSKSQKDKQATTKITNDDLESTEQPEDLPVLEDPIDLSHHLEEMEPKEESKVETRDDEVSEKTEEDLVSSTEQKHVDIDTFELKNALNLTKESNDNSTSHEVEEDLSTVERETSNDHEEEANKMEESTLRTSEIQTEDVLLNEEILNETVNESGKIQTDTLTNEEQQEEIPQEPHIKNDNIELSKCQVSYGNDDVEEGREENQNDDLKSMPQTTKVSDNELQVTESLDLQIQKENNLQSENEITAAEEIESTAIYKETIHQNIENPENNEENTNGLRNIEEMPNNCQDIGTYKITEANLESEDDDDINNVEEIQDISGMEELNSCNINEEHIEEASADDAISDAVKNSQHIVDTVENNLNEEIEITTIYDEEDPNESIIDSESNDESDEDDDISIAEEELKCISPNTEQRINSDEISETAKDEYDVDSTETNEVSSTENALEENIDESKATEYTLSEIEVFDDNHLEEIVSNTELPEETPSNTELPEEIFEDRREESLASIPVTQLNGIEENNNDIIKETNLENNIDTVESEENRGELAKEKVCNVDSANEINDDCKKFNEITSIQLTETNQGNIEEGTAAKEEIGSSFVLEIAKELLQINVTEDRNGEKIISITPLTKVKVITPVEATKENADKHEEEPVVTNNKDQLKDRDEVENEISSTVEEVEINHDNVLYGDVIEEVSETVITTEETQEIEQETALEIEEKEDPIDEKADNSSHVDGSEQIIEHTEIIDDNEILIETCNEGEASDVNIEDFQNNSPIIEDDIIPGNDLDLHNEIIIENKDEINDEILLENTQVEVDITQTEEIIRNTEERKKIQQEERILNNNYIEQISYAESDEMKSEQADKNEDRTNNLHVLQKSSKKSVKSKRTGEKKADNKKSQLNTLRNFRKNKNRNGVNSELNQQRKFVLVNAKKKKGYFSKISEFDSAERAKIFSSVVVIDKIPLETIKKVTERRLTEEKERKLREKYKRVMKRNAKMKLKDNKLSKEYKNIKTKFKRQREIARDIKRFIEKQKTSNIGDRKADKTYDRKEDTAKTASTKKSDIKEQFNVEDNNLTPIGNDRQNTSNHPISEVKSIVQKLDNNPMLVTISSDLNKGEQSVEDKVERRTMIDDKIDKNEDRNVEKWPMLGNSVANIKTISNSTVRDGITKVVLNKNEDKSVDKVVMLSNSIANTKTISNSTVNDEIAKVIPNKNEDKSAEKLAISGNSVANSKTISNSTVNDEIAKVVPNVPTIHPSLYPNQHATNSKRAEYSSMTNTPHAYDHFQVPLSTNVPNPNRKHPKELRRTKSENCFNSDFMLHFKKRRLSLEEYNNRKRNLNKLAQKKSENETKSNIPTSTLEENKEKQKMVEEVLKSLKSEEMELEGNAGMICSKEVSLQEDPALKSGESASTCPTDTNTRQESTFNTPEPLAEITSSADNTKANIENTIKIENTSKCKLLILNPSIKVIEDEIAYDISENAIDNSSIDEVAKVKSSKESSKNNIPSVEPDEGAISKITPSNEEQIQITSDKTPIETNASKCQLTDVSFQTHKAEDYTKKTLENYDKPKEHYDKSSIEEKLNSLEEFLPKIAPKDPTPVEISRKLEEFLEENPITYDQKHFEMLLIRRFLNHEILTPEELKRVRQIVQYKRAFQSMKKSTSTEIPRRRYSSEFSKSIKIDFSDFDLKKTDPVPAVQTEAPVKRKICYNRSISAFVEAESRRNEMKNRRNSARTASESKFDKLNKEISDKIFNRQSECSKQSTYQMNESSMSIKSSVIVENTSRNKLDVPYSYKEKSSPEKSPLLKLVPEDIRKTSNILSSSPRSKPISNNNLPDANRQECKTLEADSKVESMDADLKDIERKWLNVSSSEIAEKNNGIDKSSSHISQSKITSISNEIIEIDLTQEVSTISTVTVENKIEQIPLQAPLSVVENEHKTMQTYVKEEVVKPQEEIVKPLSNSSTEHVNNPPAKTPSTSNYIKHNILSIISKDNDKRSVAHLESPPRIQIIDEPRERMPEITPPSKIIKHAIQNLISHNHSSSNKYTDVPQAEKVSRIISPLSNNSKSLPSENSPKKALNNDNLSSNVKSAGVSNNKNPSEDSKHLFPNTSSQAKSLSFDVPKILSTKSKESRCPSGIPTSSQLNNEVIVSPSTSIVLKTDKPSESAITDATEKSVSLRITSLKNTKEDSTCKGNEDRQKKGFNLEGKCLIKHEKSVNKNVKRGFEPSPNLRAFDVHKEKSSKIKKFEKNQQEIASLERSVSNLSIGKDPKKYPKLTKEDAPKEKPTLTSIFTINEYEKVKNLAENKIASKDENITNLEKISFSEKKLEESPKKANEKKNEHSKTTPTANTKQIVTNKECSASSSGSKQSCSSSKAKVKEVSCQNPPNKMISKTKAQLKSFQDTIETKSKNEDDKSPNNINISPVISSITKLTALLTYYKRGLESGGDTSNLKKIKEIIDKVSPNLKNLPNVPDVHMPNEYAVSKAEVENPKLKLHLKKVHGENKKKKKRFRNLYTENDSEEDGCAEPKAKEAKTDANAIDYSVYQRKSPAGVPKLVIKRRKSDFKSGLQPYIRINRITSIESMVKKRKRTILVNQVFVDI